MHSHNIAFDAAGFVVAGLEHFVEMNILQILICIEQYSRTILKKKKDLRSPPLDIFCRQIEN